MRWWLCSVSRSSTRTTPSAPCAPACGWSTRSTRCPASAGEPVEVRVGVNTGEALVRLGVDPASGEGFLTGDAVNVAARLQSAAPPMAVAVGEATHAATENVFAFDACHPVALKGKSQPLQAWIATAPLARTGAELRSFTTSFVGREAELGTLEELLHHAAEANRAELALIVGEPGIGKSRLLAEFARRLDDGSTVGHLASGSLPALRLQRHLLGPFGDRPLMRRHP